MVTPASVLVNSNYKYLCLSMELFATDANDKKVKEFTTVFMARGY